MSVKYKCTPFTIKGSAPFPLDMLRYDNVVPANRDAIAAIHEVILADARRMPAKITRLIKLYSFGVAGSIISVERWKSFGWEVIEIEKPL